ncbi:DMT family transporter [Robiginitalea sediminis]|uniref:DMT family transporter n=1 Tax=Robiginitalea sediminis TaxID=1982593 RepID=UPI000B4BE11B|nr:DMT family transporter [Robiginitalea sediminis]
MSRRTLAILAALTATTIYGLNHTIAKGVMPHYVQPFGFILLRVTGATLLLWACSVFAPRQRIEKRDYLRLVLCAIFGMVINMLAFFKGLELSTPVNSSVLVTTTPIIVVILSFLLIREQVTWRKALGIGLGMLGALALIFMNETTGMNAPNIPMGNVLFIVNATFYGLYLITAKKLIEKYHPLVLLKWLFTIALVVNLPITLPEVLEIPWAEIPLKGYGAILFVVVGTTFLTYLCNAFALTQLKASTVSAFIYAQPVIGIAFAVGSGKDRFGLLNALATILVLAGVYLASRRPKPGRSAA